MLIGADLAEDGAGAAYLVSARSAQLVEDVGVEVVQLDDALATMAGASDRARAGAAVSGAGDVDDDGHADLLIGAPDTAFDREYAGAAYVVLGPVGGRYELAGAGAQNRGAAFLFTGF